MGSLFISLVEKAYAKLLGGYGNITELPRGCSNLTPQNLMNDLVPVPTMEHLVSESYQYAMPHLEKMLTEPDPFQSIILGSERLRCFRQFNKRFPVTYKTYEEFCEKFFCKPGYHTLKNR